MRLKVSVERNDFLNAKCNMRQVIPLIMLGLCSLSLLGQERTMLVTMTKAPVYYIDLTGNYALVFEMGQYYDKMGAGRIILSTDTLVKETAMLYRSQSFELRTSNSELLLVKSRRTRILPCKQLGNNSEVFGILNNAFYLAEYIDMSELLNKDYPLNHHSFRNAFDAWSAVEVKEMDYIGFREYARREIREINDSLRVEQDRYSKIKEELITNLGSMEFRVFEENVLKLPAEFKGRSWYFGTVMNEAAKIRPDLFFDLAERHPSLRSIIFSSVDDDVARKLDQVEGHESIKKEFFKDRRFGKTMPLRALAVYAIFGGLLVWLAVAQP